MTDADGIDAAMEFIEHARRLQLVPQDRDERPRRVHPAG
jgi:hypothetical protein